MEVLPQEVPQAIFQFFDMSFNGTSIGLLRTRTAADDSPDTVYNDIIIPPYTEVQVTITSGGTDAAILTTVLLTGKNLPNQGLMYEDYNLEQLLMRFLLAAVAVLEGLRYVG